MDGKLEHTLEMLDNTFSDYLMKKINDNSLEKRLSVLLSDLDLNGKDKRFEISIVQNNRKEPFFGMRIFPVMADMNVITGALVNEHKSFKELYGIWSDIKNWYIEIDSDCFDRLTINFIPKELTAILLHEIGHVVYSNKVLERFYRAYQETYMRMKIAEKASLKILYILYSIPFAGACMLRNWTNGDKEINEEIFADATLIDSGYSQYLLSAIGKIIKVHGTLVDDCNNDKKDDKIQQSVNWCNLNIVDLTRRKNKLKDDLFYQTARSNSSFIKAISMKILNDLGLKMRESYSGFAIEATIDVICQDNAFTNYTTSLDLKKIGGYERAIKNALESTLDVAFESFRRKGPSLPSEYDIDAIYVEADRIENHHDRIYVLDLVYSKIKEITDFKELIHEDSQMESKYLSVANGMLKQLEDIRKNVLSKRSFNKDYKVFVKYPPGYEG